MAIYRGMARIGDITTGHGCFAPTVGTVPPPPATPPNVFVNGLPAHKFGDEMLPHTCDGVPHSDTAVVPYPIDSMTVFINGKLACRIGDLLLPDGKFAEGSHNVFIGAQGVVESAAEGAAPSA